MANYEADRLLWLREDYTRGYIQQITGIHWKTQESVIAGTKALSTTLRKSLTSFYGKAVYSDLKGLGFSASQAGRFRYYTPSSVDEMKGVFSSLLADLAEGATVLSIRSKIDRGLAYDVSDEYDEMYEKVKQGIINSKKSYEEWTDYPM